MRVLYIEWIDAVAESGWDKPEKLNLLTCKSIGFLVKETKEAYYLAAVVSGDECNATIAIPKSWVNKKKWVKL